MPNVPVWNEFARLVKLGLDEAPRPAKLTCKNKTDAPRSKPTPSILALRFISWSGAGARRVAVTRARAGVQVVGRPVQVCVGVRPRLARRARVCCGRRRSPGARARAVRGRRRRVPRQRPVAAAVQLRRAHALVGRLPLPPLPGTKWTRRVPHPVLIGHAASLSQVGRLPLPPLPLALRHIRRAHPRRRQPARASRVRAALPCGLPVLLPRRLAPVLRRVRRRWRGRGRLFPALPAGAQDHRAGAPRASPPLRSCVFP